MLLPKDIFGEQQTTNQGNESMKKLTIALGAMISAIASPLYAAQNCPDFSGTYVGSCDNYPSEYSQVRSVVDQNGCDNVQVILDIALTELNEEKYPGVPVGTTLILRSMDMNPSSKQKDGEVFVRTAGDTVTTITRDSKWRVNQNNKYFLKVKENTKVEISGEEIYNGNLVGSFFLDANDNTINLNLTKKSEMDPFSSGDCKLFKLP